MPLTPRFRIASLGLSLALTLGFGAGPALGETVEDFSSLSHGQIVNNQLDDFTVSAVNFTGPDLAVAFDTDRSNTNDPDLEYPFTGNGNLAGGASLGNALIIQEHGSNDDGFISTAPDDEGHRPAGNLYLDFHNPINSIGFDLLDVEGPSEYDDNSGFVATFYDGGSKLGDFGFGAFVDPGSAVYDSTIQFGHHSANRIAPISASLFNASQFDRVQFSMGGSGAIDNVTYSHVVPTPTAAAAGLLGLGLVAFRRRRHTERA